MKTKMFFTICFLTLLFCASAQTFKEGAVVVTNTYTFALKPDVTMKQWIDFYKNKYIPEMDKAYPGVTEYILWGDRGENKNQFSTILVFESVAVRDKYYPVEDSQEASEAVKIAQEKVKSINEEMNNYLLPGGKRTYTDWIVK